MKKILALMAMLTLASGAWADDPVSYSFQLSLQNVSAGGSGGTTDSTLYFVNTATKQIYAAFSRADLTEQTPGQTSGLWNGSYIQVNKEGTAFDGYTWLETAPDTLTSASIQKTLLTDTSKANLVYIMSFSATGLPGPEDGLSSVDKSLAAYLYFGDPDKVKPLVYDSNNLEGSGFLVASMSSRTVNYQGTYLKAVPEPTSGLLMLLGIAGLALKRRKVA